MELLELCNLWMLYLTYQRYLKVKRGNKRRRWYVRPINLYRNQRGEFSTLVNEMRLQDTETHFRYFRMSKLKFNDLLTRVGPLIMHGRNHRLPVTASQRLALTLRILATGDSQQTVAICYRLGKSTVHKIFHETCAALKTTLQDEFMPSPTIQDWKKSAEDFTKIWNFPNCVGAIDGKHVIMKAPTNSGSKYFNYKGSHSIVLMAVVSADYRFMIADIGAYGRESDGGVFRASNFGKALMDGSINFPLNEKLPGSDLYAPHVLVGDAAFPLRTNLMRPYPGSFLEQEKAVFNYRLSRGRRIVENGFGILAARWRIFRRPIELDPENCKVVVNACILLHNYLISAAKTNSDEARYLAAQGVNDLQPQALIIQGGEMGGALAEVGRVSTNTSSKDAINVRNTFKEYFMSASGSVPWQMSVVNRGKNDTQS